MTQNEWDKLLLGKHSADSAVGITTSISNSLLQQKIDKLNERINEKTERLKSGQDIKISGFYDADSPMWANPNTRKPTARLTGEGYYVDSPELKIDGVLNQAGINARIQADSYAMGVDAPNFPEGEGLEPKYYQQYIDAMNPLLVARQEEGKYSITPLNKQDIYGRELVTAQSEEMPMSQTDYLLAKGQGVKKELKQPVNYSEGTSLDKFFSQQAKTIEDKSYWEQIRSLPKAMLAGAGKSAYDAADVYTELAGDVTGRAVGLLNTEAGRAIDKYVDLGTEEEKTKRVNELIGYDNRFTEKNMEKLSALYEESVENVELFSPSTWKNLKTDKLIEAAKTAFKDIETAGYSLGYMIPALFGAFGKGGAKIVGGQVKRHYDEVADNLKSVAEGKISKEEAKRASKESLKQLSKKDKVKLFLVNNADALNYGAMMNNNQLDEYIENNGGEDATILRSIFGTAANAVGMKLDMGVMNSILAPSKGTAIKIRDWLSGAGESKARAMLGKVGELTIRASAAGLTEMPQEWAQTFIEEFNTVYGTKDKEGSEIGFSEAAEIARTGAGAGALAGLAGGVYTSVGTHGTVGLIKGVPSTVQAGKRTIERATETPVQKQQREAREYSEPLKQEAMVAAVSGDSSKMAEKVEELHGRMIADLDESADKKATYNILLKEALTRAEESDDETYLNNVYKTIADLDKDENVDFQAKDMFEESSYEIAQEFLSKINQDTDTSDSRLQKLREGSTESLKARAEKRSNIIEEIKELKRELSVRLEKAKSVMGSDQAAASTESLTKIEKVMQDYIDNKDLDAVNMEFVELGFIVDDSGMPDPNRPGLAVYERELTKRMLNPKTSDKVLKSVKGAKSVSLEGLKNFATSRLRKLQPTKNKEAYQTDALMDKLKNENEQMIKTITKLLNTAKKLKNVDETTKKDYQTELKDAARAAIEASNEIDRRKALIATVDKPKGVKGTIAFQVEPNGKETIQLVFGDTKTKLGDVVDGKVVLLKKYANATSEVKKPTVEVKEPTKSKVESAKSEVAKEPEVDLSNLSKADRTFIKNYRSSRAKPTAARTERYNKLMEKAKQHKKIPDRRKQERMKIAPQTAESKDEAKAEVKRTMAEEQLDSKYKAMSKEEAAELQKELDAERDAIQAESAETPLSNEPLQRVRLRINSINKELGLLIASVPDMEVKKHVKDHYTKKLGELQEDRTRLGKLLDRLEITLQNRLNRVHDGAKLDNMVTGLLGQIDKLINAMLKQLNRLNKLLKKTNKKYSQLAKELTTILEEINEIERGDYTSEPVKTTIGTVATVDESVYGKPILEVDGERIVAEKRIIEKGPKAGKEVAQSTALNDAMELVKLDKMAELRDELKAMPKGQTSLSAKLIGRLLLNFPMNNAVHKIIKRTNDSVFGKLTGNPFADTNRLLEALPKSFKKLFASDKESREALLKNFKTMAEYLDNTEVNAIKIGDKRLGKNIDNNGLAIYNVEKDGETFNFPVEVLELIGTVKDGKLQIDEQTKNILKFYTAKMLSDSDTMIGKILSFDESEMSQYLGITDPNEQIRVKQEAAQGYVNSASIRKDIGREVYQALGIKLNENAPEFTEESFISALGVLVQAIATDNGSMDGKPLKAGGKNQNLVKANWESVYKSTIGNGKEFSNTEITEYKNSLIKSVNKLQYMNENRNRPLPSLKKPKDNNNRMVMNTRNPMDKKSVDFLNKQEKIAYKISPRLQNWLDMDETEALKAMGYMDIETSGLHVSEIAAQMARNDKLVREWEILKTFAKATKDKEFYLSWGQTVSGRYTILNDINYQESKLHREFVVAEGSTELVDVNNKDARQMLEASILQGLDMDPDKLSPETASAKFNETFKVTDKGIEVTKEGPIKRAYESVRDGKVDAEAMAEVFKNSEGHHGISSIELLAAWDKAIKDGTKLETHANLEIDAITSGMILTLLQIGSDEALRMAEKGGIYTSKRRDELEKYVKDWLGKDVEFTPGALIEAGKKHASAIEDPENPANADAVRILEETKATKNLNSDEVFKDLYSTIGVAMIGEVQAYKETLLGLARPSQAQLQQLLMLQQIGDLNLKNIRSIAKSPVMVYIYGATLGSIKKKLTYSLGVDTLVKALKNASKLLKEGKDASAEMNFINGFLPENKWKFVNEFGAKIPKPAERWEQLLAVDINGVIDDIGKVINATFGKAIEAAFDSRLGFVNKNRDAAKAIEMLVFQTYQVRLTDEIQKFLDTKYGVGRHKGESYKLSKQDMQLINSKLTDKGYGHNIVWYEDGETVNQTLNKTSAKGGKFSTSVTVGETSVGGQIKEFKPAVNTGAAPTISVHAIDGRMMLDVLNREIGGKYTGGNIYDAVVLSVNKAMLTDTADSYNTNMIETGFNRSVIADQLEMLENMFYIKDEAGNKQFDELTFNKVLASIGLRPKGELRDDYTKEANRIGLGIGKMLDRLERAEMINGERLVNSGKEFHSGHLYQMGSGVVKVDAANTRAKQFPVIDTIKRLLTDRLLADRKITHAEFAKDGVKLHKDTDYVVNLDDAVKGSTQIASKANIVQIKTVEGKMTATDRLWGSLGAKDTVQIIASKLSRQWLESKDAEGSPKYWADRMLAEVLKSDAKIVANGFDEKLEKSGRVKVDDVWVKKINEGKADAQEEVGKLGSVQYVQDKIAPWIELDEFTKQELAKITDKSALDKIAEDINCRKG